MATLVLQYAGAALGSVFGPLGAIIGRAAGAVAGGFIDASLFGPPARKVEGPRLKISASWVRPRARAIPRVWGRMRVSGQVIWATRLRGSRQHTDGRRIVQGRRPRPKTKITEYTTSPISRWRLPKGRSPASAGCGRTARNSISRACTWRFYPGSEDQEADSLIVAKEGATRRPPIAAPSYIVFERLPLERFGNRLPQLSFEVFRPIEGCGEPDQRHQHHPGLDRIRLRHDDRHPR